MQIILLQNKDQNKELNWKLNWKTDFQFAKVNPCS